MVETTDGPRTVTERANELYWSGEGTVEEIVDELGISRTALYTSIEPVPSGVTCADCNERMVFPNRTARDRGVAVCPRCGRGWGKGGEVALLPGMQPAGTSAMPALPSNGSGKQAVAVLLFLFAALMVVIGFAAGEAIPAVIGSVAASAGIAMHRSASIARSRRREALISALQLPVLKLAGRKQGHLTVTEVATELGWTMKRAEKVLQSLDDGLRVTSDVTDEGVIVYEFPELLRSGRPAIENVVFFQLVVPSREKVPEYAALKREIDAGALGEVYHARGWMLRRSAYIPTPTFVYRTNAGGGATIDIGVHILDLLLWMMGNPRPISVSGVARTELSTREGAFSVWHPAAMPRDMDVEEFAAAFVRFDNGATLMLEVSWALHHETPVEDMQMWLYGREGGAHWPSAKLLSTGYNTRQLYTNQLEVTGDLMPPHALECMAFAEALADGRPSPVPPEQSLQVTEILDAIYRSQATGREIRLDEEAALRAD